jgi:acyl dehydratase
VVRGHGREQPLYTDAAYAATTEHGGIVAPPAMLQAWCLEGLHMNNYPPGSTTENPYEVLKLMEGQGYASVVAVNSDLSFERYVKPGERLYYTTRLDSVGEQKTTALGTGFFVTLVMSFFSEKPAGDEKVGSLLFRVFKFRPANPVKAVEEGSAAAAVPKYKRPKPGISDDTRFSGRASTPASCASSAARAAAPCATRRARCAPAAIPSSGITSRPPARASSTPSW